MRESMGSAWVFSICLTFIVLFTAYLTITLNYARAFRVKNYVVTYIEEHEGYIPDYDQDLVNYLHSEGYATYGRCEERIQVDGYEDEWVLTGCVGDAPAGSCGVCIYGRQGKQDTGVCADRSSYRVVAFFKFDIPVVRYMTSFEVGGESRYIHDFANTPGC